MSLSPDEAAQALRQIDAAERLSRQYRRYRYAAPQLYLWSVLWLFGYGGTALRPDAAGWVWGGISVVWALATALMWRRASDARTVAGSQRQFAIRARRLIGSLGIYVLLLVGTAVILHPRGDQIGALIPLLVAIVYLGAGVWGAGPRFAWIGAGLAALTIGAYVWAPGLFLWIMAVVGGGALA
ncbi:MAG: hypothetical protein KGL92_03295, partial [Gammaproteobacteria bacterium]|nr:hypothetical protein [Gammaproteobacteria bacterium]